MYGLMQIQHAADVWAAMMMVKEAFLALSSTLGQGQHSCARTVAGCQSQRSVSAVVGLVQRGTLLQVLLHPIIHPVDTVAPYVAFLWNEFPGLGLCSTGTR